MTAEDHEPTTHNRIRRYYDEVHYRKATASEVPRHLRRLAVKVGVAQGLDVLDVACGTGEWLRAVRERGGYSVGTDLSSRAIAIGQARMPDGAFSVSVAEALPFASKRFHVVSCLGSLEHFLDVRAALVEMARVARDDAIILLLVPNAGFLSRRLSLYRGTAQVAAREEILDLPEWRRLFEAAGLEVQRRWRDLHVLSWDWICLGPWYLVPVRALQAAVLAVWPLAWQYQVYHLCRKRPTHGS